MTERLILVVDDDATIRTLLRDVFEGGGFAVCEAACGAEAIACLAGNDVRLVTLDLKLGAEDGLDVARRIRKTSDVPIVMVTGRGDVLDRVIGLEIGADDYITKPFHVREVLARVRSVLRRMPDGETSAPLPEQTDQTPLHVTDASPAYGIDGLVIVPERFELFDRNGDRCDLTSGDFKLLDVFVQNAKRVLSRDRLMDLTGGAEWSPLDRTIDNQVARLRKKIERKPGDPQLIKTVRGVGYTLACDVTRLQPGGDDRSAESRRAKS
ncbi:response regulator [Roseivivax sp. CAU 1753]